MNGLPRAITLQHETARPPWIIRVIFNQYGLRQSLDNITYPDLVLPYGGDPGLAVSREHDNVTRESARFRSVRLLGYRRSRPVAKRRPPHVFRRLSEGQDRVAAREPRQLGRFLPHDLGWQLSSSPLVSRLYESRTVAQVSP